MGGFFGGDDDEAPPINFTPYEPIDATKSNPPINFMRIFDNVSQQEFVFKKSPKGERYLQLKNLIQQTSIIGLAVVFFQINLRLTKKYKVMKFLA